MEWMVDLGGQGREVLPKKQLEKRRGSSQRLNGKRRKIRKDPL